MTVDVVVVETEKFVFEDNEYEIRVCAISDRYEVAVYLGDQRVNGYTYSVDVITDMDVLASKGIAGHEHLMDIAKTDVRERRWEQYLKALREIEALDNPS